MVHRAPLGAEFGADIVAFRVSGARGADGYIDGIAFAPSKMGPIAFPWPTKGGHRNVGLAWCRVEAFGKPQHKRELVGPAVGPDAARAI